MTPSLNEESNLLQDASRPKISAENLITDQSDDAEQFDAIFAQFSARQNAAKSQQTGR